MIKAVYSRRTGAYNIRMMGFPVGDTGILVAKFDTGAAASVISITSLYSGFSNDMREVFRQAFSDAGIPQREFKSATGHGLSGYPCIAKDVWMSKDEKVDIPFYLVIDSSREIALLGDDFISHCAFSHEEYADIIISDFNADGAIRDFGSVSFVLNELSV